MNVQNAFQFSVGVHNQHRSDFFLLHQAQSTGGEFSPRERGGIFRHAIAGRQVQHVFGALLHHAAEVAIGDDAQELAIGRGDGGEAQALAAHFVNHVRHFGGGQHPRRRIARMHQRFDATKFFAQASTGMQRREVFFLEAAAFQQRNCERVAHGHRRGRGGGRCEIERASFFFHRDIQNDVARAGERRARIRGEGDQLDAETLHRFDQFDQFLGFSARRNRHQHIVSGQHAQIAVQRFGSVQK